jgi:hypothetical protein
LLRNYREGTITFGPTYKYIMKTDEYDLNRMPAYTDRILFESVHDLPQKNPLMNIYYGKINYNLSDHKPVTGLFEAKIKVIDDKLKQKIIDKLIVKYQESEIESSSRKQTFIKYIEASREDTGAFQINHFAGRSKSLAERATFSKASVLDEEVEQLDADNFLKLENYDMSKINEN